MYKKQNGPVSCETGPFVARLLSLRLILGDRDIPPPHDSLAGVIGEVMEPSLNSGVQIRDDAQLIVAPGVENFGDHTKTRSGGAESSMAISQNSSQGIRVAHLVAGRVLDHISHLTANIDFLVELAEEEDDDQEMLGRTAIPELVKLSLDGLTGKVYQGFKSCPLSLILGNQVFRNGFGAVAKQPLDNGVDETPIEFFHDSTSLNLGGMPPFDGCKIPLGTFANIIIT